MPEWLPRWRPWIISEATLRYEPSSRHHRRLIAGLKNQQAQLHFVEGTGPLAFSDESEAQSFFGLAAAGKALGRTNFIGALFGAAILLGAMPTVWLWSKVRSCGKSR